MAAPAPLGATRLLFLACLLAGCGKSVSTGPTARPGAGDADSGASYADSGASDADSGAGSQCPFTACGGDVVGTWTIQGVCPVSMIVQNCPEATLDPRDVTVSGTFTFGSDGVLTIDIQSTGTWEGVVPPSCVAATDCHSIAGTLFQPNAPPATCTDDGNGGCVCSSPATPTQTGTRRYQVAGTTAASMAFCIENDSLKLMNEAGTVFVATRATPSQPAP